MSLAPPRSRPIASPIHRRSVFGTLLGVVALVGAVVWYGSDRLPADATRPLVLRGVTNIAANGTAVLRIGTFNIHGGRGARGEVNLDATADVLRAADLDLACLYEVRGAITTDQAQELGTRLAMASLFVATERRWWHEDFGNGLLTRRPLASVMRIDLPGTQGKRFRNAILSTVDVAGERVKVLAAHIDTEQDREKQLATVFELFRSLSPPVVLIGDLNCTATHPRLAALLAEPGVVDAVAAHHGDASQHGRIDHLIVRGLAVREAHVVATDASDHPHVWAELSLPQ